MSSSDGNSASSHISIANSLKASDNKFWNCLSWLSCWWCKCKSHRIAAVDSVRLVYMRRIEDMELNSHTQILHRGRMKRECDLDALENALKEYESKNKGILNKTASPTSFILRKESRISRYNAPSNDSMRHENLRNDHENSVAISNTQTSVKFDLSKMAGDTNEAMNSSSDEMC